MRRLAIISAAVAAAGVLAFAARAAPMQLFVLAGQSNMAGNAQAVPAERAIGNVYDVTLGPPKPALDPLGDATGYGPGRSIGATLAALMPGTKIGLVMCAKGASSIFQWQVGGDLYQRCLERIAAAQHYGTIAGIFFLQGEYDTLGEPCSLQGCDWPSRFEEMVDGMRAAIGVPVKVVYGQLGRAPSQTAYEPGWDVMKTVQETVTKDGVHMIRTDDIPSDLHYDWAGYQRLGARFAWAWYGLTFTARTWRWWS